MSQPFHEKHRPTTYKQVLGQKAAVRSLFEAVKAKRSRAFLLSGPPGLGKTTLARIAARQAGADFKGTIEIDGATNTSIDDMREVQDKLIYKPFNGAGGKAVILDEAHGLSKQAWSSLLKVIEEPPEHVTWFLCTTEPGKVPAAVASRCLHLRLLPLKRAELRDLLIQVRAAEGLAVPDDILDLCLTQADGSPRQALVNLAAVSSITDLRQARELLREVVESEPVNAFCLYLTKGGGTWAKGVALLAAIPDLDAEAIRLRVCQYLAKALSNTTSDEQAVPLINTLDAFATPYHPGERLAPLYLSMGKVLFHA